MENNIKSFEQIIKESGGKGISVYNFNKTYPAYLIFVLLLFVSFFIFNTTKKNVRNEQENEFKKAIQSVETRISNSKNTHLDILTSMRGLYDILPQVVRDYFEIYGTVPTKTYESISSIVYVMEVNNSEKGTFVYNTQNLGYYYYKIIPEGERNIYYPVQLKVPYNPEVEDPLLGFDLKTIPEFADAFIKAKETKQKTMSDFVTFDRNENKLTSFIFYPIYPEGNPFMKGFQGALAIELDVTKFIEEALSGMSKDRKNAFPSDSTIIFEIIEVKSDGKKESFYKSSNYELLLTGYTPSLTQDLLIEFPGKNLEVKFYTVPNFGGTMQAYLPYVAGGISLILSFLLSGFILSIITSRGRALDLAERMTRSQRRIVETTQDIIAAMDLDGVWKSMNPASQKVFGYESSELIGKSIYDLLAYPEDKEKLQNKILVCGDEQSTKIDLKMTKARGPFIWVNWTLTKSLSDGLVYVIGRDITLEKLAEEEAKLKARQMQLASYFARESDETKTLFMVNASHQLRNSLTGVLGYLQLLNEKMYESEEEKEFYLKMAEMSSEEILSFVSDFVDVAIQGDLAKEISFDSIKLTKVFYDLRHNLKENITFKYDTELAKKITLQTSESYFERSLYETMLALSEGLETSELQIEIEVNDYEKVLTLQILAQPNPLVHDMIELYKQYSNNLIEALKFDKNEIVFKLAKAASKIRIINGSYSLDSFGKNDLNIAIISLPLQRKINMNN